VCTNFLTSQNWQSFSSFYSKTVESEEDKNDALEARELLKSQPDCETNSTIDWRYSLKQFKHLCMLLKYNTIPCTALNLFGKCLSLIILLKENKNE